MTYGVFYRLITKSPFAEVVTSALDEARLRGARRMGTEHLFLGLLRDADLPPARALGVDLDRARAALDDLDHAALHLIGIETRHVQELASLPRRHPPVSVAALTAGARSVVRQAVDATTTRTRHTAPRHLLIALLDRGHPDPVAELITHLGIDRVAVRERLAAG